MQRNVHFTNWHGDFYKKKGYIGQISIKNRGRTNVKRLWNMLYNTRERVERIGNSFLVILTKLYASKWRIGCFPRKQGMKHRNETAFSMPQKRRNGFYKYILGRKKNSKTWFGGTKQTRKDIFLPTGGSLEGKKGVFPCDLCNGQGRKSRNQGWKGAICLSAEGKTSRKWTNVE